MDRLSALVNDVRSINKSSVNFQLLAARIPWEDATDDGLHFFVSTFGSVCTLIRSGRLYWPTQLFIVHSKPRLLARRNQFASLRPRHFSGDFRSSSARSVQVKWYPSAFVNTARSDNAMAIPNKNDASTVKNMTASAPIDIPSSGHSGAMSVFATPPTTGSNKENISPGQPVLLLHCSTCPPQSFR